MADQLTATGLSIDDLETRRANKVAKLRAAISSILDVGPDQPIGQILDIINEHDQLLAELLQTVYSAIDPDQAVGRSLDAVSSITGTYRRAATAGTVVLTVNLNAVTTLPTGSQASVSGDPDNIWETTEDVTSVGAGNYTVNAECTTTGPVAAPAGTITVIVTPVLGWNSVTNVSDATLGEDRESDADLRVRREIEAAGGGSTSVDAVRAALSQVDGVLECYVIENDFDVTVDGLPPHSIEAIYWDGGAGAASTADVAEAIFEEKAGGIRTYGSAYVTHVDDQGGVQSVGMTLADDQRILVEVDVDDVAGYVGDAAVALAIEAWALANLGIGTDVYRSKISAVVVELDGVLNVSAVRLAINPAAPAAVDINITLRQIATIDAADVTVFS